MYALLRDEEVQVGIWGNSDLVDVNQWIQVRSLVLAGRLVGGLPGAALCTLHGLSSSSLYALGATLQGFVLPQQMHLTLARLTTEAPKHPSLLPSAICFGTLSFGSLANFHAGHAARTRCPSMPGGLWHPTLPTTRS